MKERKSKSILMGCQGSGSFSQRKAVLRRGDKQGIFIRIFIILKS
ncbi:hypothetical protein BAOM_1894 [Peribacillus asahii]|uniref:Uncharacterized protein n=1 Tax=Peribacillus asahii TaxID=228899 RepID=A0A3T0KQL5_9BACI|nr:hypothetical protein BAOM_1894 [Peribacillus asahii]